MLDKRPWSAGAVASSGSAAQRPVATCNAQPELDGLYLYSARLRPLAHIPSTRCSAALLRARWCLDPASISSRLISMARPGFPLSRLASPPPGERGTNRYRTWSLLANAGMEPFANAWPPPSWACGAVQRPCAAAGLRLLSDRHDESVSGAVECFDVTARAESRGKYRTSVRRAGYPLPSPMCLWSGWQRFSK
ncbi:hypothetical protein K491DRAFT_74972 [Lophiostoma macrostomum CBS 122681]|uniref:Uncharacterized protein n=1 Tax=Lophiostoma macrostomum CBS 122681 TaxID=1314788 RepID=A0A6A6SW20_9PLEO|nr:hypothetical protein K491DRAFT_74972 [Lophiostoma macrostomum CBS 122681]